MDQDLLAYLEQRFASIDQRFQETGQNIQALREEMTQRFASVDQSFENLETEVRGAWVTIEDLRGQVKLVAEGMTNNGEQLERHREEFSRRFDAVESLIHRSYEDLEDRVSRLEAAAG